MAMRRCGTYDGGVLEAEDGPSLPGHGILSEFGTRPAPTPARDQWTQRVAVWAFESGEVFIPFDCQSDPEGKEGRWVDARTGREAIVLDGEPARFP